MLSIKNFLPCDQFPEVDPQETSLVLFQLQVKVEFYPLQQRQLILFPDPLYLLQLQSPTSGSNHAKKGNI